jgi:hypothetical protein
MTELASKERELKSEAPRSNADSSAADRERISGRISQLKMEIASTLQERAQLERAISFKQFEEEHYQSYKQQLKKLCSLVGQQLEIKQKGVKVQQQQHAL